MSLLLKTVLSLLPFAFVAQLLATDFLFSRRKMDVDGAPPIAKYVFWGSKYSTLVIWTGMVLELWGVAMPLDFPSGRVLTRFGIVLWVLGFALLFAGRFSLGLNFRIGVAKEATALVANGIYRFSRNPMYLGLFTTFLGCTLFTSNLVYLALSLVIVAIHHRIVLGEEQVMRARYGSSYARYCETVRRYL